MHRTLTETQPCSSSWSLPGSEDWDLLGPNPRGVSMGHPQLSGVFCFLLVADKGSPHPRRGLGGSAGCLGFGRRVGEHASLPGSIVALHQGGCYQPQAPPGMPVLIIESFAPLHSSELYTLLLRKLPIPFCCW